MDSFQLFFSVLLLLRFFWKFLVWLALLPCPHSHFGRHHREFVRVCIGNISSVCYVFVYGGVVKEALRLVFGGNDFDLGRK